jgi:hypothetical protein
VVVLYYQYKIKISMTANLHEVINSDPNMLPEHDHEQLAVAAGFIGQSVIVHVQRPKNLEALRYGVRGTDEAVLEIGTEADRQVLTEILENPGQHTRDELLAATFANYSGEAYGDNQWTKKIGVWGESPEVITAYGELIDAHPEWGQLSLDPGFMTHLPQFMTMLNGGEITEPDYEGARQQLKDKLGDKIVWRGTMLTDEEFARTQTEGLGSPLSRVVQSSEQPTEQFEASALSAWASYTIEKHFHGEHRATPFLSVSEHPEVATAVGRHFGDRDDNKNFYLFKLQVPAIDLVSYTDHAVKAPTMIKEMQSRNPDFAIRVGVNGVESEHKWDETVESFVNWKIDPSEILEVSQPDISESSWNGRVTRTAAR